MSSKTLQKSEEKIPGFVIRIEELREVLGLNKTAFAKKINTSVAFYSEVTNYKSGPSANMIFGIAKNIDNINLNWLLLGHGEMFLDGGGQDVSEQAGKGGKSKAEIMFELVHLARKLDREALETAIRFLQEVAKE